MKNKGKKIHLLLGISGGIAAYKIPSLVRLLTHQNIEVKVVITEMASDLVGVGALRTVSGNPVYQDTNSDEFEMGHISLADWTDVFLIAPATANTIAKITHGIADNLLSTLALSCDVPMIVVPAMNNRMWNNLATQANIDTLKKRNISVLPVGFGELACGDSAEGRMLSIKTVANAVNYYNLPRLFSGKKVLISSGPTEEKIDPVRVITNLSSGKMGSSLAMASLMMGADVTVISGPAKFSMPEGVSLVRVNSANDMQKAMNENFDSADIVIMAAAVSDYRPSKPALEKMRRQSGDLSIELTPNPDILATISKNKNEQFITGFSLETDGDIKRAVEKMEKKNCDMMVYNQVENSLGTDDSIITLIYKSGEFSEFPIQSKTKNAAQILLSIAEKMGLTDD